MEKLFIEPEETFSASATTVAEAQKPPPMLNMQHAVQPRQRERFIRTTAFSGYFKLQTLGSGYDSISFQGLDYSLFNFEFQCENSKCISTSKTFIAGHVFCSCSCHSSAATCPAPQPPSAVKNNPAEMLVGQKSLPAYVISKPGIPNPHQQSLIWSRSSPLDKKKKEYCVQMEREILAVGHNHEAWTFVVVCNWMLMGLVFQEVTLLVILSAVKKHCVGSVRCVETYSIAWLQLCTPQEPLDSDAFVWQLTLKGGSLPSSHGDVLQRPLEANHSGFRLGRKHG